MSADNYIFVSKQGDGQYAVSMRFASAYYADEESEPPREYTTLTGCSKGWSVNGDAGPFFDTMDEAIASSPSRPDWIEDPPKPAALFAAVENAVKFAHKWEAEEYIVEYGVTLSEEVRKDWLGDSKISWGT